MSNNLKKSTASGSQPVGNAFTNYENKLQESKDKFSISTINNKISAEINKITGDDIVNLNKLTAAGSSGGMLDKILNKLGSSVSSLLSASLSLVKDMAKDALNQTINAAVSLSGNIFEDFIQNLKKSLFINDKVVLYYLKATYNIGADLAYKDHYIRNFLITHDLVESLEWLNDQYTSKGFNREYKIESSFLNDDLSSASSYGCHKVIYFIFDKLYSQRKNLTNEKTSAQYMLDNYYSTEESRTLQKEKYEYYTTLVDTYTASITNIEKTMVEYFKKMIVYSYTYLDVSSLEKFLTDFKDIIIPKYYGTTDDKYNKTYIFNNNDMNIMMPYYSTNETTSTDKFVSEINEETSTAAIKEVKNSKSSGIALLDKYRKNLYEKQARNQVSLLNTANKSGSNGVYKSLKSSGRRGVYVNSDGIIVKKLVNYVQNEGLSKMLEEPQYITLRNKNIRNIYTYLSSEVIFGENRMRNGIYYERCKIDDSDIFIQSLSKSKGILGSSQIVQMANSINMDSCGYDYLTQNEKYIFNPVTNVPIDVFGNNYNDTSSFGADDPNIKEIMGSIAKVNKTVSSSKTHASSPVSNNVTDVDVINNTATSLEEEITNNTIISAKIDSVFRFIDEIPLYLQQTILSKYLNNYYSMISNCGIPNDIVSVTYSRLIYVILGKDNITNSVLLADVINNLEVKYISTSLRSLASIYYLNNLLPTLDITNDYTNVFNKIFRICMGMMIRELQSTGFTKTVYNYDRDYLQSLTKQTYESELKSLKKHAASDYLFHDNFYNMLDNMNANYTGYNISGILGYDSNNKRIKYTEYTNKDWGDIHVSQSGTIFVSGHELTNNNIGILKYDYANDSFKTTNITSGYYKFYEYGSIGPFALETSTGALLHYKNENWISVTPKNVENSVKNDFKLTFLPNNDVILQSFSNNGFYLWNTEQNTFDLISPTGGNYSMYKLRHNRWILFSKTNKNSKVYIVKDSVYTELPNIQNSITSFAEIDNNAIISGVYTTQQQSTDASGNTTYTPINNPVTNTIYIYNLLLTCDSVNGVYRFINISNSKDNYDNNFSFNKIILENFNCRVNNKNEINCFVSKHSDDILVRDVINSVLFKSKYDLNIGIIASYDPDTFDASTYIKTDDIEDFIVTESNILAAKSTETGGFTSSTIVNEGLIVKFDDYYYLINTNVNKIVFNNINSTSYKFENAINGDLFCYIDNGILYIDENYNANHIFEELDRISGWEMHELVCQSSSYEINKLYYFINLDNPKGIRMYDNSSKTTFNVGINTGNWQLYFANNALIAASYTNTNEGLRISNNISRPYFTELDPTIHIGSYSSGAYDYRSKRLYLATCRENTTWDVSKINYDIEEFIYGLDIYTMQKLVINYNSKKFEDLTNQILQMFVNGEIDITGDIIGSSGSSNSDFYHTLTGLLKFLEDEIFSDYDSYLNNVISTSGIFLDILTYAATAVNFNDDSEKAQQNMQAALMMLYSLDSSGNINFNNIMARYRAYIRNFLIINNTDSYGNLITEDVGSSEWNAKHDYLTRDFLDSDETTDNYYNHKTTETVEYVKLNPEEFDLLGSYAYISKKYGISLFFKLTTSYVSGYNTVTKELYYKTDYDTEIKYYNQNGAYRELYVRKQDLNIIISYK